MDRSDRPRLPKILAIAIAGFVAGEATMSGQAAKPPASGAGYHLLRTFSLPGGESWSDLAIDSAAGRIFVPRSSHLMVVDAKTGACVGTIPLKPNSRHEIALATDLHRAFATNMATESLTLLDVDSLLPIVEVKTGEWPTAPEYDASAKRVFTLNQRSNDITAIDATSGEVVGTLPGGGKPEDAVADGRGHLYVSVPEKGEIVAIDTKRLEVVKHWSLAPQKPKGGLAVDAAAHRLFVGCDGDQCAVVNTDTGKLVATVRLNREVHACVFDPTLKCLFACTGERSLSVIHEETAESFSIVEHLRTGDGICTLALDTKSHELVFVTGQYGAPEKFGNGIAVPIVKDSVKLLVFGR